MHWPQFLLALLMIGLCGILLLVILLQRGKGGGLAGAFGGGGGGGGAFGAKTGDVLTWATVILALLFLLVVVVSNFAFDLSPKPPSATPVATDLPDGSGEPGATIPSGATEMPIELLGIDAVPVPAPTGAAKPPNAAPTQPVGDGSPAIKPATEKEGAAKDNQGSADGAGDGSSAPSEKPTDPGGS